MHCYQAILFTLVLSVVPFAQCAFKSDLLDGTYNLASAQNFDAYLKALGVGFFTRQLSMFLSPEVVIERKCPRGDEDAEVGLVHYLGYEPYD